MTTNLTFKQAISNGKLAYYYWLYEVTQDMCCENCAFKMGYDPDGDVFCYGQCFDSYEQEYKVYFRKQLSLQKRRGIYPSPFFYVISFKLYVI